MPRSAPHPRMRRQAPHTNKRRTAAAAALFPARRRARAHTRAQAHGSAPSGPPSTVTAAVSQSTGLKTRTTAVRLCTAVSAPWRATTVSRCKPWDSRSAGTTATSAEEPGPSGGAAKTDGDGESTPVPGPGPGPGPGVGAEPLRSAIDHDTFQTGL